MDVLKEIFEKAGGEFLTPLSVLKEKLQSVKALVFDWDGVFNSGIKSSSSPAGFSEADSMGLNLLRFDLWCRNHELPLVFIVTGEDNPTAISFAKRERLHGLYRQIKHKTEAIQHICETNQISAQEIACFGDDVSDLSMAGICGLRILLKRNASPLFQDFVKENKLADYITGQEGGSHGIREACELLLGLGGHFRQRLSARISFDEQYKKYFEARNEVRPNFFEFKQSIVNFQPD